MELMTNERAQMLVNQCQSTLERMRMAALSQVMGSDSKHGSLYRVFGLPTNLEFQHKKNLYDRNGVAGGAIDKLAAKTWESYPELVEGEEEDKNKDASPLEKELKKFAKRSKLWRAFRAMDTKRMVGNYSAIILQIADGKDWSEPVENLRPDQIVGYYTPWEDQLTTADIEQDRKSPRYGEPNSWSYQELVNYDNTKNQAASKPVTIHWTRVIYFGDIFADGSCSEFGNNLLARGYNAFQAIEKIVQSGGEGFFKNAARQLQANFSKDAKLADVARMMGVKVEELGEAFQVIGRDLNSQFDSFMVTQDVAVNALSVAMPNPKEFFDCALQEACASLGGFPATELVGHMTGERASSENGDVMAMLATSRRVNVINNDIEDFFAHLGELGCFKGADITPVWSDLLEPTLGDKLENAKKMAEVNKLGETRGESYFTTQEVRVAGGSEPMPSDGLEELPEEDEDMSKEIEKVSTIEKRV